MAGLVLRAAEPGMWSADGHISGGPAHPRFSTL